MPTLELPALYADNIITIVADERLILLNRDPGPDETGVPLDWPIALEVLDTGTDGVDRAATRVFVDGVLAFDGGTAPELQPGYDGPRAEVVLTSDTLRLVLDPIVPLTSEAEVEVRIISTTLGGAHALDQIFSFFAEDRTGPRVLAAQANSPTTVLIGFDEEVAVTENFACTFTALDLPAVPLLPLAAEAQKTLVRLELATDMTPDVRYRLTVSGVTDLHGNTVLPLSATAIFSGFRPPRPRERNFDLWSMFPKHLRRDDATGDLKKFAACLQEVVHLLLVELDRFPDLYDLERSPEPFLDAILTDLAVPFPFELDLLEKRRLASVLVEMYCQKGTALGLRNAVRFFLGLEVTISSCSPTLVLGEAELDDTFVLGPSDRFALYAFEVQVDRPLSDTQRRQLAAIIDYLRPVHTHALLREPLPPPSFVVWELGEGALGSMLLL